MELTIQIGKVWSFLLLFFILVVSGSTLDHQGLEPEFDGLLPNLTVRQGSDVSFTCVVKNLGVYKVAWIRSEDKAIIAWHNHMVTHNPRFWITHNGHDTWTLHIKNVQQNDSGSYLCHVNTTPQRNLCGTLNVVIPADIIDTETSSDVVVCEGQTAILKCKATGYPPPKITWKRQDGQPLPLSSDLLNPGEKFEVWEGERLSLRPLLRSDAGPYWCLANNSVPPGVSKTVMVIVKFQPSVKVQHQLVAAPLGVNVTLECYVEAKPKPDLSWFNNEDQLILNAVGKIWQETEVLQNNSYRMRLFIAYLQKDDFSDYICIAQNGLGADYGITKFLQLQPTPVTSISAMRATTNADVWNPVKPAEHGGDNDSSIAQMNIKHRRKLMNWHGHGSEVGGENYKGCDEAIEDIDSSDDMISDNSTNPYDIWDMNRNRYGKGYHPKSSGTSPRSSISRLFSIGLFNCYYSQLFFAVMLIISVVYHYNL